MPPVVPLPPVPEDAVARAVTESWRDVPHFAVSRDIDVTGLAQYVQGLRVTAPQISLTDVLLAAAGRAWQRLRPGAPSGVGLSVATSRRVINVTVGDAGDADLAALASRRRSAVERARRGMLSPRDFAPCEVTVSNLGTHGVDWFTGIIPHNQLALLTIGRARETVQLAAGVPIARTSLWVTANLDHRYLDGVDGAQLLEDFAAACALTLGDPSRDRLERKATP
jgi:pyruvate dehydrogenase E2 component (dihydrolipoamide acetyltransferase)